MKPAARILDLHTCPMATPGTPPIPHVGGPVLKGATKVFIGMMPAARLGDTAFCVGPPDVIAVGSATVMIEMAPAARLGDMTAHGGVIVMGFPKVLIGDSAGGPAFSSLHATATVKPTAAQVQEIQDALDAGNQQLAINLTIAYYGIDVSNAPNGVQYDATESNYGVTDFQGNVNLGPAAMASPDILASTIVHETTHANQAAALRASDPTLTGWPNSTVDYDEAVAYDAELNSAHNTGLSHNSAEMQTAAERRAEHINNLSAADQSSFNNGTYPP